DHRRRPALFPRRASRRAGGALGDGQLRHRDRRQLVPPCRCDDRVEGGCVTAALSDDELLDLVQRQTLKYFWDFAHPVSGLARERSNQPYWYDWRETVTSGGSGFGI